MGNISKLFLASTQAEPKIVKFGRDRSLNTTTLQITENGEYDVRNYTKAEVSVAGEINTKTVVNGYCNILQLPSGLVSKFLTGEVSAIIKINMALLDPDFGVIPFALNILGDMAMASLAGLEADVADSVVFSIAWNIEVGSGTYGEVDFARALMGGSITDVTADAGAIPYELTIYEHPMPEEEPA